MERAKFGVVKSRARSRKIKAMRKPKVLLDIEQASGYIKLKEAIWSPYKSKERSILHGST